MFSKKHRIDLSLLSVIAALATMMLMACTAAVEPPASSPVAGSPAAETPTVESPQTIEDPVQSPTASPVPTDEPTAPATGEATPPATLDASGQLPVVDEMRFTVEKQFGGVPRAVAVDGSTVYAGFGPRLLAIDASDPADPLLLGRGPLLPGLVRDLAVAEGIAYVAAGPAGLILLDVSDPAAMAVLKDGPNYAGADRPAAVKVTVSGDTAYVVDMNRADGRTSLLRFDVSDPAQVTLLDATDLEPNDNLAVGSDLLVIVGNSRLQLRDAADPGRILSNTPLASGSYASLALIEDDLVTVVESGGPENGIERFDVSDPFHPAALGDLAPLDLFFLGSLAGDGRRLFSGGTMGEFGHCGSQLHAVDLSGERPQVLSGFNPENCLNELALQGDNLFVAGRSGLQIYDVSDPAQPRLLSLFRHPDGFQDAQGAATHQDATYVLTAEGRSFDVMPLDLSGENPAPLADRLDIGTSTLLDLFLNGETLIVPVWMGGLNTLDVSDPADPRILHQPAEGELTTGDFYTMVLKDNVLYTPVVDGVLIGGIGAIDLSDPANPRLAATVETKISQVLSLAVREYSRGGDWLYALTQDATNQVHVFDLSQPLDPRPAGVLTLPEAASRLAVVGDVLYAACDGWNCQHLYAVDVSDPQNPRLTTWWSLPFGVQDMVNGSDGIVYMLAFEEGIWALDAADPENVRLAGRFQLPEQYARLKVDGDQILAAAFDGGLYLIRAER